MKSETAQRPVLAGFRPAGSNKDRKNPMAETMVAGSWGAGLDQKKTQVDLKALGKTMVMPSPVAGLDVAKARAALNGTILLRPVPKVPAVPKAPSQKAPPARAFDVEIIENVTSEVRYREAMRRRDEQAFLLMTDFAANKPISAELLTHWQKNVRVAVIGGANPETILESMNRDLSRLGLEATATCARFDVQARRVVVASAGGPAPFIVHSNERMSRVRTIPSDALGRVSTARFREQHVPFGHDDVLFMPSTAWVTRLERIFAAPIQLALQSLQFALRERRTQPMNSSILRLTMH